MSPLFYLLTFSCLGLKQYVAEGIDPDDLAELYPTVHEAIRENPVLAKKERVKPAKNTQ